jgi:hypothetical protein
MTPDPDEQKPVEETTRRRDQAEGGETLGAVDEMIGRTPGQAEGERDLINEKLEDDKEAD